MTLGIILLLTIFSAALWFWRSRTSAAIHKETLRPATATGSLYHAVLIESASGACDAAVAMQGKPFLANQTPALPLPTCNHERCQCHYRHRNDRRDDERRSAYALAYENIMLATQQDRRQSAGRRQPKT